MIVFIGHFALGFATRKIDQRISLGTSFIAVQLADLLWPVLVILGIESVEVDPGNTAFTPLHFIHYPYSHSLFYSIIWATAFAIIYFLFKRNLKIAIVMGLLVLSHWFLDLLTHTKDLPVFPWSEAKFGFELWNSVPLTIIIEGSLFIWACAVFLKNTAISTRKARLLTWGLMAFLGFTYILNIIGPLPNSGTDVAIVGLSMWLIVGWGYWIDRNTGPAHH